MKYVVRLNKEGYRSLRPSFLSELSQVPLDQRDSFLKQSLLVNVMSGQEKKHRAYHFI